MLVLFSWFSFSGALSRVSIRVLQKIDLAYWNYQSPIIVTMAEACPICCETFNRSDKAPVCCEQGDCEWTACKTCTRQYLLGTTQDPHCMNCRKTWSQEFLVTNLNHSWMSKDYREHRKKLLLDREMSKVPEAMEAAQRTRRCRDEELAIAELRDQILVIEQQKRALQQQQDVHYRQCRRIRQGKDGADPERRKFIMACPNTDCRGYLSTAYKCEICKLHTCKDCLEIIGYNKDEPHVCNTDSVASAAMIRKDTHPCPTCGERIYKISGCDQMWCPHCSTAFSWKTGKIDTGHVHNPHFYQAQRARNNGEAPRNPGDVLCGGLMHWSTFRRLILNRIEDPKLCSLLTHLHQAVGHLTYAMLDEARRKVRELAGTEDLRVQYILGELSKDELAKVVARNDRQRTKWTEFLHLYELLSVVGIETFQNISASAQINGLVVGQPHEIQEHIQQYHTVRTMCNEQFQRLSVAYSMSVPQWDESWTLRKQKFTAKALRDATSPTDATLPTDATPETNIVVKRARKSRRSGEAPHKEAAQPTH